MSRKVLGRAVALSALAATISVASTAAVREALRSDLTDEVVAALGADPQQDSAGDLLARIAGSAPGYHFGAGPVTIDTDRRWFATLPAGSAGAPLFELRRWPGDSVLAVYAVAAGTVPAVPDLTWEAKEDGGKRSGVLVQAGGRWRARWGVRDVPASPAAVGILLLAGDGGLGEQAVEARLIELDYAAAAVQVDADLWRSVPAQPAGSFDLPLLPVAPAAADERKDAWQVVEAGSGTMSVPPGVLVRRTDLGVPPPRPVPGGVLWLRGRFKDREGAEVVVGDAGRAGYVAEVPHPARGWAGGQSPPLGLPKGTRAALEPFALAADRARATQATAARWTEPGFDGAWLVFRLQAAATGVEIALPVSRGRTSPALFWIPVTYRPPGTPPAPPPVDPSDRLGIRFEPPLPAEARRDPTLEGRIMGPGFHAEVPKGWWPRATLRAVDGFPIEFIDAQGRVWGALQRLGAGEPDPAASEGWTPAKRPAAWGAIAAWTRPDGALALRAGEGALWRLTPAAGAEVGKWQRLSSSLALLSAGRRHGAATEPAPRRGR